MESGFLLLAAMMVAAFCAFFLVKTIVLRMSGSSRTSAPIDRKMIIAPFKAVLPVLSKVVFLFLVEIYFLFITKTSMDTIIIAMLVLIPVNIILAWFIEVSYCALTK